MDKRCPRALKEFPSACCEMGKNAAQSLGDESERCEWYVNDEKANYCVWKWLARRHNDGATKAELAELLNSNLSSINIFEQKTTKKFKKRFKTMFPEQFEIIQKAFPEEENSDLATEEEAMTPKDITRTPLYIDFINIAADKVCLYKMKKLYEAYDEAIDIYAFHPEKIKLHVSGFKIAFVTAVEDFIEKVRSKLLNLSQDIVGDILIIIDNNMTYPIDQVDKNGFTGPLLQNILSTSINKEIVKDVLFSSDVYE